jgi:hypothetical protein
MFESAAQTLRNEEYMPYAPAKPVLDIIRRDREQGLPEVLSRQQLHRLSVAEGNSDRVQKALQFLDLIDQSGKRTPLFDRLRKASTTEYESVLAEIVRGGYAPILAIVDPKVDNDIAVNDAFRHYEPAGQRKQMVVLFRALCQEAGLAKAGAAERKPSIRKEATAPVQVRRTSKRSATEVDHVAEARALDEPSGPDYRLLSALIQQLPRDGKWTQGRRDRWLQAFTANIDLLVEVGNEQSPEG